MNVCADKNRCAWPRSHRGDRFERFRNSKQTGRNPPDPAIYRCPHERPLRRNGAASRLNGRNGRRASGSFRRRPLRNVCYRGWDASLSIRLGSNSGRSEPPCRATAAQGGKRLFAPNLCKHQGTDFAQTSHRGRNPSNFVPNLELPPVLAVHDQTRRPIL